MALAAALVDLPQTEAWRKGGPGGWLVFVFLVCFCCVCVCFLGGCFFFFVLGGGGMKCYIKVGRGFLKIFGGVWQIFGILISVLILTNF